jgi:hypothetical protein
VTAAPSAEPLADPAPGEPEGARWWEDLDVFDLVAVIVMSITAILTAWTGYQSAKWSGVQAAAYSEAGAARTEAVLISDLTSLQLTTDLEIAASWLNAVAAGNTELAAAYRSLFSPTLETATQAWEADTSEDRPPTPLGMDEYDNSGIDTAQKLLVKADASGQEATDANQTSDNYVLITVLSAMVLFFAALSTKLRPLKVQVAMLALSIVGLAVGVVMVLTFPIEL